MRDLYRALRNKKCPWCVELPATLWEKLWGFDRTNSPWWHHRIAHRVFVWKYRCISPHFDEWIKPWKLARAWHVYSHVPPESTLYVDPGDRILYHHEEVVVAATDGNEVTLEDGRIVSLSACCDHLGVAPTKSEGESQ